jgi:hypothetical protein
MPSPLQFLDFDLSEDAHGLRSWCALASPLPAHGPALQAEVQALLHDLTQHLGDAGPVDEGHAWDVALDTDHDNGRTTVSLHLSGGDALAECLTAWTRS